MGDYGKKMVKEGVIPAAQVIAAAFIEVEYPGSLMDEYATNFAQKVAEGDAKALTVLAKKLDAAVDNACLEYNLGFPTLGVR